MERAAIESDSTMSRAAEPGATPWYLSATAPAALAWLTRGRWLAAAVDLSVLVIAAVLPQADFPLRRIAPLLALSAVVNVTAAIDLSRGRSIPRPMAQAVLLFDVMLLTGLLELTGGPFNPFSVIYVVHVALAAVTLGRGSAIPVGIAAAGCYGLLIYWHIREGDPGHHRLNDFPTHLISMWVAVSETAELLAYFVVQASNAVARREQELEAMRVRAARSERLASLTTLAAGAAHELSTPLATIALTARELEHAATRGAAGPVLIDDARLIRTEVDRCRAILDQMSGRAGGSAADEAEPIDVPAAIGEAVGQLPPDRAARVRVQVLRPLPVITASRPGFCQALLSLLGNAFDASRGDQLVTLVAEPDPADGVRIAIRDDGAGMAAEVLSRAGEPFFTTKEPGLGLGLGIFLARVFAERCGGSLTVHSTDGTTVTLALPAAGGDGSRA